MCGDTTKRVAPRCSRDRPSCDHGLQFRGFITLGGNHLRTALWIRGFTSQARRAAAHMRGEEPTSPDCSWFRRTSANTQERYANRFVVSSHTRGRAASQLHRKCRDHRNREGTSSWYCRTKRAHPIVRGFSSLDAGKTRLRLQIDHSDNDAPGRSARSMRLEHDIISQYAPSLMDIADLSFDIGRAPLTAIEPLVE